MKQTLSCDDTIKSFDSTNIYYVKDIPQNSKAVVVIIHGFSEHLGRYESVKDKFNEYGYAVYRYDVRGHGMSGGKKGYIQDFNHFIIDNDIIIDLINKENSSLPIFIMGYSMGGFIAACYGVKYGKKINGQILSSAATMQPSFTKGVKGMLIRTLNHFYSDFKITTNFLNFFLSKKDKIKVLDMDDLTLKESRLNLHVEFLIKGTNWLNNNLHNYNLPCLLIHGEKDRLIRKETAEKFHDRISSSDRQLKIYNDLSHEIFNNNYQNIILDDMNMWISDRLH